MRLPIEDGMCPDNLFPSKANPSSFWNFIKYKSLEELLPRLFRPTPSHRRSSRFPKSVGTCPTNLFLERAIISSREALDSEAGIGPKNLLVEMDRYLRLG